MTDFVKDEALKVNSSSTLSPFEVDILFQVITEASSDELDQFSIDELIDNFWKRKLYDHAS